jgi:hypothetical protein
MKQNHELFNRDPRTANLANDGQARLVFEGGDSRASEMLRYELEHFVCEGQYAKGMQRILDSFLDNLGSNAQRAAWVSGFYGSGKSHLLKMLCHLWVDTPFSDGAAARALAPDLTKDILASLKALDIAGRKTGGGLFAVSGTMPEGSSDSARLTVLSILFKSSGLPPAYNQAMFCLYLKDKGFFETVRQHVEDAGRDFSRELTDLYVSPYIRKALLAADPGLGDEKEVRQLLREQFPTKTDIDTSEFIRVIKEVLKMQGGGSIPLTIFVIDEVQHYIGDDKDRSRHITELAEALNKQMDAKILLVMAGQNALSTDTPQFAWLRDRFTIPVELSDADVETVTRKVLLLKKPQAVALLETKLIASSGEIERQLSKSRIAPNTRDRDFLVPDYPILPTRRRFWEAALHAVDPSGSSSLLRTQLRITHEALRAVADEPVGHTIPGDFMFFQQQTPLVQQGVLSREISDRILRLDDGTDLGRLMARTCGLVFLIRKLPRERSVDTGLRATEEVIGDLLVEDLASDGAKIRKELPDILKNLVELGVLLFDGEEYNLQTRESAEWDDKFRTELAKIRQDSAAVSHERKARLQAAVEKSLKNIRTRQGVSLTPRDILVHFGIEAPTGDGSEIPIWIRDGWESAEGDVVNAARAAGHDSPIIHVFLPKSREDSFRDNLLRMKAAQAVIDIKGVPTTREAEEARDVMETRRRDAERNVDQIIRDVLSSAKAFKGGGAELHALELIDKIQDGTEDALSRLFPRFSEADHKAWSVAIERARKGDESPLQAVGWKNPTEDHPVCKEVEREVGSGKEGRLVRAQLEKDPFGWPRDAIDAALIALHSAGRILAKDAKTGEAIQPRHLDQNRIPKASFRTESITLGPKERIALKGLIQSAGISVKPDDDLNTKAGEFLDRIITLAQSAGGDAPLPARPSTIHLDDLRKCSGNEQLMKILEQKSILQQQAGDWKTLADLTVKRLPVWKQLETLLSHGDDVAGLDLIRESCTAILNDRLLLDATDHCGPLIKKTADLLRAELSARRDVFAKARESQVTRLDAASAWKKLAAEQQHDLLVATPIAANDITPIATEDDLAAALRRAPLPHWQDRIDALPARVDTLLAAAAKLLEPKAQRVTLPSATLKSEADLDAWLAESRQTIAKALKDGPVIL